MSYVITISRQYGSGGRFIAQKLADKLHIKFYDNELITKAVEDSGMAKSVIEKYDEKKDGFFSNMAASAYFFDISLEQRVFLAQFDTIRKIAQTESCVIVGRCADYVLRDKKEVVNVFIHGKIENRINRAIKYYGIIETKAREMILKTDKNRASYYQYYTDKKWGRVESYDLCINSDIGINETVEIIYNYIQKKLKIGE